jgi:hypothetical protein
MTRKRYFHIQNLNGKNTIWNKGNLVTIDDLNYNSFYKDLTNSTGRNLIHNGENIDLLEYAKQKEKEIEEFPFQYNPSDSDLINSYLTKSQIYRELAYEMNENLIQYLKWIREEVFENYRKQKFPNLPSRKTCLWLCEKKDINEWWKILYPNNSKKIIEINFNSEQKIHCGNGSLIISETLNIHDYMKLAEKYWNGEISENCEIETLFEGDFEVINEFEKPEDI